MFYQVIRYNELSQKTSFNLYQSRHCAYIYNIKRENLVFKKSLCTHKRPRRQGRTQDFFKGGGGGAKDRNKVCKYCSCVTRNFEGLPPSKFCPPPPLKGLFFGGGGAKPPKLQNATLFLKDSIFNCTDQALISKLKDFWSHYIIFNKEGLVKMKKDYWKCLGGWRPPPKLLRGGGTPMLTPLHVDQSNKGEFSTFSICTPN